MDRDDLEYRSAAIARALAISLNDPSRAELEQLEEAGELHPTTRCRIAYLRQFRDAVRSRRPLDDVEMRFFETMAEALESLLGLRPASRPTTQARVATRERPPRGLARA